MNMKKFLLIEVTLCNKILNERSGFDLKTKQELRKEMKDTLQSINKNQLEQWSQEVAERVFTLHEWKQANTIGITISGEYEVNTTDIIKKAWELKKRVAVPKCHSKKKKMTFRELTYFTQLEVVYYDLKEPIEELTAEVLHTVIVLLFVPGLSFEPNGFRLGHGGGYYDRYLAEYQGDTLSLAFPKQIVEKIPVESFDIPVQKIVTNKRVIKVHY